MEPPYQGAPNTGRRKEAPEQVNVLRQQVVLQVNRGFGWFKAV